MGISNKLGFVIGIDPDITKNGVACIRRSRRELEVEYLTFPETLEYVKSKYRTWKEINSSAAPASFMVYVEAGWLNKGNWHVMDSRNGHFSPSAWAAAVGKSDGECSAVSKKLIECFEYYGIPVTPQKPLRKYWKGPDRKITHEELVKELELYKVSHNLGKRSNPEKRDAALIALVKL